MSERDDIFGEESEINEMYAEELKEASKEGSFFGRVFSDEPEPAPVRRQKSPFAGLSGVEDISLEDIDRQTPPPPPPPQNSAQPYYQGQPQYGGPYQYEPEKVGMEEPIMPAHNDLRDRSMTNRNGEPTGYVNRYTEQPAPMASQGMQGQPQPNMQWQRPPVQQPFVRQSPPQQSVPAYQVGENDPYATDNFNSIYTDTSNYQAEAMAAQMRGQTVTYGAPMYGTAPQPRFDPQTGQPLQQPQQGFNPYDAQGRYDPQNVYGQNGQYQQQGRMSQAEGLAMVDQMLAQGRRERSSLYESIPSHQSGSTYRSTYRSTPNVRPGMDRRERAKAQVDQMIAQDRASHAGTDRLVQTLNSSGSSYGRRGVFGAASRSADERPTGTEGMGWYFLWFIAGALVPFGAFDLHFAFCLMIGSVFGVIGAIIKHNGMEGFDLKTSLSLSKTELLLVPITAAIALALYFYL